MNSKGIPDGIMKIVDVIRRIAAREKIVYSLLIKNIKTYYANIRLWLFKIVNFILTRRQKYEGMD
jgi:hypothetical protein